MENFITQGLVLMEQFWSKYIFTEVLLTFIYPDNVGYPSLYAIKCNKCNLLYIGKTQNKFKIRLSSHILCIKNKSTNTTLHNHFQNKDCFSSFSCFIIDNNQEWYRSKILQREAFYQKFFNTIEPNGLNDLENSIKKPFTFPVKIPYGTGGLENCCICTYLYVVCSYNLLYAFYIYTCMYICVNIYFMYAYVYVL